MNGKALLPRRAIEIVERARGEAGTGGRCLSGWWRRLFPARGDFVSVFGAHERVHRRPGRRPPWLAILGSAMALSLLGWSRWREVVARAAEVDSDWRGLGAMLWPYERWETLRLTGAPPRH